ncbi:hypothetical protein KSP39_PZI008151 [Platanthera zijinensis]|uniref:Uncharacterized protein n=1 Tax=Platanthera zijinensis TaxID=2320716 RepID=A0AAP0BPQ6_9ASPA
MSCLQNQSDETPGPAGTWNKCVGQPGSPPDSSGLFFSTPPPLSIYPATEFQTERDGEVNFSAGDGRHLHLGGVHHGSPERTVRGGEEEAIFDGNVRQIPACRSKGLCGERGWDEEGKSAGGQRRLF